MVKLPIWCTCDAPLSARRLRSRRCVKRLWCGPTRTQLRHGICSTLAGGLVVGDAAISDVLLRVPLRNLQDLFFVRGNQQIVDSMIFAEPHRGSGKAASHRTPRMRVLDAVALFATSLLLFFLRIGSLENDTILEAATARAEFHNEAVFSFCVMCQFEWWQPLQSGSHFLKKHPSGVCGTQSLGDGTQTVATRPTSEPDPLSISAACSSTGDNEPDVSDQNRSWLRRTLRAPAPLPFVYTVDTRGRVASCHRYNKVFRAVGPDWCTAQTCRVRRWVLLICDSNGTVRRAARVTDMLRRARVLVAFHTHKC